MIERMAAPDDDDAFAATVAPAPSVVPKIAPVPVEDPLSPSIPKDAQTPSFKKVVLGTREQKPPPPLANELSYDATMAAQVTGEEPPLPEVQRSLYETAEEIARGGMGRIVAAEDRRLHRPVALKELLDPNEDSMPRFQREALITARLQHPGIVPVYLAGRWPTGEPFFAMKLVSGRPLDRVIAETETLSERLALLPRLAAACDAIAYAHSQRIIHRDLKPGNVLIGDFGETVVIDWGLAKDLDAADSLDSANRAPRAKKAKTAHETASSTLTVAGSVMGTPAYMAPEQARGEAVDQRADVFALGAMLYHVLAGAPPYIARTATDVIAAAALGKIIPLRERVKNAPRALVAILDRAMAPKQADRYPTAGALAEAIELIGRAEHVSGKPDQALETWRQARDKLVARIGNDKQGTTFRLRSMIAKLDIESAQIYQERGDSASAHRSFEQARDEYAALQREQPKSRATMLAAAETRDVLGDLYRHAGK